MMQSTDGRLTIMFAGTAIDWRGGIPQAGRSRNDFDAK